MNIRPLGSIESCPACGGKQDVLRACRADCLRSTVDDFFDGTTHGKTPDPHVHVTCCDCGFTFLQDVVDRVKVEEVW